MPSDHLSRFARVTIANFFFFLAFASFFLLPLHVRALGGSERTIGVVMGTAGVAALVGAVAVGGLLDRFGSRGFLLGGLATMSLASATFVVVDRVGPALFVLRIVQGLAFAAAFNAASTLAVEFAPPERRAAALGLFGISTLTTHAIAPTLGELLVRRGGFNVLFLAAAAFSAIGFVLAWPLAHRRSAEAATGTRFRMSTEIGVAVVTIACCGVAFGGVITYVPTFVHDADLGPVATFFLSYTAAAVLTRVTAGGLGDSLGHRPVLLPALALLTASVALLAIVHSRLALAVTGVLFGAAQGLVYPTLNAFTIAQAAAGQFGRTQTLYNAAFNVGTTSGAMALGIVAEAHGYRAMFLCASAMAAAALAVFGVGAQVP